MFPPPSKWSVWHVGTFVFSLVTVVSMSFVALACVRADLDADHAVVAADVALVRACVLQKYDETGALPQSLEECDRLDPWRQRYVFVPRADGTFDVFSRGPDLVVGTDDDTNGN
ncbi:MAG: type II secretion system protein GspG [bacterium]